MQRAQWDSSLRGEHLAAHHPALLMLGDRMYWHRHKKRASDSTPAASGKFNGTRLSPAINLHDKPIQRRQTGKEALEAAQWEQKTPPCPNSHPQLRLQKQGKTDRQSLLPSALQGRKHQMLLTFLSGCRTAPGLQAVLRVKHHHFKHWPSSACCAGQGIQTGRQIQFTFAHT